MNSRRFVLSVLLMIAASPRLNPAAYPLMPVAQLRGQMTASDEEWINHNYRSLLDLVFPNGDVESEDSSKDARWIAIVRIEPPFGAPEASLSLTRFDNGKVKALVVRPKNDSLLNQIRVLRAKYPQTSIEEIAKTLAVNRQIITGDSCPQLIRLAKRFERISVRLDIEEDLRVDETGYLIWSKGRWGSVMKLRVGGPGAKSIRQPNLLLYWVEEFRRTAQRCGGSD